MWVNVKIFVSPITIAVVSVGELRMGIRTIVSFQMQLPLKLDKITIYVMILFTLRESAVNFFLVTKQRLVKN